ANIRDVSSILRKNLYSIDFDPQQKSFKDQFEVPYGTKGSSRPDFFKNGHSIEVKNYDVTTPRGRSNLVRNVSNQINKRVKDLPPNTKQTIIIDVRGQNYNKEYLKSIRESIIKKSNYDNVDIMFMTR
ncbi:MAG: hypothetical protein MH321_12750, partial [Leptospiraceae bacterium]|nr:hypothetical protein [Leptospiraceae bacterium]